MAINVAHNNIARSDPPAEPEGAAGYRDFGLKAHWEERVIAAVAVSVALMIVAAVAVLMGMV
ncbi:MAG: hypothetical protein K9G60_14730 [Pseudolabrys sp.]|nr:hypothetical protein [Pseudolabrys sp.]